MWWRHGRERETAVLCAAERRRYEEVRNRLIWDPEQLPEAMFGLRMPPRASRVHGPTAAEIFDVDRGPCCHKHPDACDAGAARGHVNI